MKTTVTHTEYRCDHCGAIVYADDGKLPTGYWGDISTVTEAGVDAREWYADKPRCVPHAVRRVLAGED